MDSNLPRVELSGETLELYKGICVNYRGLLYKECVRQKVYCQNEQDDLVQQALVATYRYLLQGYRINAVAPFLRKIQARIISDYFKKRRARAQRHIVYARLWQRTQAENAKKVPLERSEWRSKISHAISLLQEKYQRTLIMFFSEGRSYEEIASILGIPRGTVGIRIFRALRMLRQILSTDEEFEEFVRGV